MRYLNTKHPVIYEINTRIWLAELSRRLDRTITLDQIPIEEIDRITEFGFDLVWLMGVWELGEKATRTALNHPEQQTAYKEALPDFGPEDVQGSPYAPARYRVDPILGGDEALASFRDRLAKRGAGLILDFIPNHTGIDHHWIFDHPEYYVQGDGEPIPGYSFEAETSKGTRVIMHGRDPHFEPWTDTAQLNYRHAGAIEALKHELIAIAERCDGVRCDMAMLVLADVFENTWGVRADPLDLTADGYQFWPEAIRFVREGRSGFFFIAEAYWNREWDLQQMGFDYTYDKTFYDRLMAMDIKAFCGHLNADADYQAHSLRYLENHDEKRVAGSLAKEVAKALTVAAATVPGMMLIHDGQMEGRRARVPVQLKRRRDEAPDADLVNFHKKLLKALEHPAIRGGHWKRFLVKPAWPGNPSVEDLIVHYWTGDVNGVLVAVNLSPNSAQGFTVGDLGLSGRIDLKDYLSTEKYVRDADEIRAGGLYLEIKLLNDRAIDFSFISLHLTSTGMTSRPLFITKSTSALSFVLQKWSVLPSSFIFSCNSLYMRF